MPKKVLCFSWKMFMEVSSKPTPPHGSKITPQLVTIHQGTDPCDACLLQVITTETTGNSEWQTQDCDGDEKHKQQTDCAKKQHNKLQ
jgi:hypothetical protein